MNTTGKIVVAALTGAAVGAAVALLLAPASGKETRAKLAETLSTAKNKVSDLISRGKEAASDIISEGKETAKDLKHDVKRAGSSLG